MRPMIAAPHKPGVKPCCQEQTNLVRTEEGAEHTVDTCDVCGCRHWRVYVDLTRILYPPHRGG